MTTRRDLLKGGLALGGLAAFGGAAPHLWMPTARAEALATDQYFIFCYFNGGWDLLLSLDPRDPRKFRNDLKKVTRIQTGYDEVTRANADVVRTSVDGMDFGPFIGGLASHADKLTVIRGINMDTLTHEVGRRRFITGRAPAGLQAQGSSLATILAAQLGTNDPIPQLSVRVESYNDHLESFASAIRVNSVDDLLRALRRSGYRLRDAETDAVEQVLEAFRVCDKTQRSAFRKDAFQMRQAAKDLVTLGIDSSFDFAADGAEMEAVRDLYGFSKYDRKSAGAQAAAAVTAITSGIARTVSIEAAKDLDAHGPDWASSHGPRLEDGFDVVSAMISDLESRPYKGTGDSWLDHTTIVCFSEFGRTPLLNSSGGRDHFLHNACVIAGGGVPGGRVIGQSSDVGMAPTRMSLATGAPDAGGEIIRPEHIYKAILEHVGITEDVGDYRVAPLTALYA